MAWRKTHYAANPRFTLGNDQAFLLDIGPGEWHILNQGGKVVIENERRTVVRISYATRSLVSRAQVTGGIVCRLIDFGRSFGCALPWTLGPVWRNQYPLIS